MRIIDPKKTPKDQIILGAIEVLLRGGLVIYPTETCYGLGADATNEEAVRRLLLFKNQPLNKPVSVAVADRSMAEKYVEINRIADNLYRTFLPGPLTVVSRSRGLVVPRLESAYGTLGIRIPNYPLTLELIRRFSRPITSTSANMSGKKVPYSLEDIKKYTSQKHLQMIDLFISAGKLPPQPPSTVVDTTMNEPAVLRQGEIIIPAIKGQNYLSSSESETQKIAGEILNKFSENIGVRPLVFALQGELGAGKTQFTKGIGRALGIKNNIVSPTFTIIREYPYLSRGITGTLYHLDTWRLEREKELLDLGIEQMLKPENVIAIEWMQKIRNFLKNIAAGKRALLIWVALEILSESKRKIKYVVS